jgi:DNA-binding XRE family transcriptional regulator
VGLAESSTADRFVKSLRNVISVVKMGQQKSLEIVRAQEIIRVRRKLRLTQAALARRAGIRVETLNRIEQGKHSPTMRTMQKIDRALKRAEKNAAV